MTDLEHYSRQAAADLMRAAASQAVYANGYLSDAIRDVFSVWAADQSDPAMVNETEIHLSRLVPGTF
jgi:hypothetical protein